MRNKIFIFSAVILFGIIVSYVVFSWSEPTGNMPTNYKPPLNTSANAQDVDPNKPVIGNLNVEKLGGYTASDLLGLIGGPASYEIVEGTACPTGTILTSKYYAQKTCSYSYSYCTSENQTCVTKQASVDYSTGFGWALDPSYVKRNVYSFICNGSATFHDDGTLNTCGTQTDAQYSVTCQAPITHVLCLTVTSPE